VVVWYFFIQVVVGILIGKVVSSSMKIHMITNMKLWSGYSDIKPVSMDQETHRKAIEIEYIAKCWVVGLLVIWSLW
jgi:hypothetical protein